MESTTRGTDKQPSCLSSSAGNNLHTLPCMLSVSQTKAAGSPEPWKANRITKEIPYHWRKMLQQIKQLTKHVTLAIFRHKHVSLPGKSNEMREKEKWHWKDWLHPGDWRSIIFYIYIYELQTEDFSDRWRISLNDEIPRKTYKRKSDTGRGNRQYTISYKEY